MLNILVRLFMLWRHFSEALHKFSLCPPLKAESLYFLRVTSEANIFAQLIYRVSPAGLAVYSTQSGSQFIYISRVFYKLFCIA